MNNNNYTLDFLRTLPVWAYKEEFEKAFRENDVIILEGETGSGKSTVIPYLIHQMDGGHSVVVTQPRRLPTVALANYMAKVLEQKAPGGLVGYWHGLDKAMSKETQILFCTDGVEVVLQVGREMESRHHKESVLVVDEIHEWNNSQETLIAILRANRSVGRKIVILSATMDVTELRDFFGNERVATLSVPGRLYPVTMEEKDAYQFISTAVELMKARKNVLMFVEGKKEINSVIKELKFEMQFEHIQAEFLPLHSELTWEEQRKCYQQYDGVKVIVATNIAQTSLTLPDISAVVDNGNEKRIEVINGIETLVTRPISQADCLQRKGRAGRVCKGEYYLCSDVKFEERMEFSIPEIKRSLLELVVLRLLAIGMDPEKLCFFHQPDLNSIILAKASLERLGAIKNLKVTPNGKRLLEIPVDPKYGQMILQADQYGVMDDVITIVAIMSVGSLLGFKKITNPWGDECKIYGRYDAFTREEKSDLLGELDIWNQVKNLSWKELNDMPIQRKNLERVKELRTKLVEVLRDKNFECKATDEFGKTIFTSTGNREKIVEACLYGMLNNIFVRTPMGTYSSENGKIFELDRKSCTYVSKIVYALPKGIETKKYYNTPTLNLLTMVSQISFEKVMELLPHLFKKREKWVGYLREKDCCLVAYSITWNDIEVSEELVEEKEHPRYAELKAEWQRKNELEKLKIERWQREEEMKAKRQPSVEINGTIFSISYPYDDNAGMHPYITISLNELFGTLKDVDSIVLANGRQVTVWIAYEYLKSISLKELRNTFENRQIQIAWKQAKEDVKKKVSSKRSVILNWADILGEKEIFRRVDGTRIVGYQHLIYDEENRVFRVRLFDEEQPGLTNKSLQKLFEREFDGLLTQKKFEVKGHDGKKVLTAKGREALRTLQEDVELYGSDVTFENYESYYAEVYSNYERKLTEVKAEVKPK